ncbi:DUF4252 domain-containing protein [Dysgonomonas massiliensis]|uniref:DUF4252 domain-containing protein n=1 Tax=Dysgonomonas massiliensis TaxID=2040292 RepID=UPI000C776AEA|nr:DUF4252 domain-containing protein [Dysgonomonas massiliensis]
MKRIITLITIIAITFSTSILHAENIENIVSDISKEKKAENVKVGGLLMSFAKMFANKDKDKEGAQMLKCINSIQVIDLDYTDSSKKNHYMSRLNKLNDEKGFETLVRVKDKEDNVRIMLKRDGNKIKGFYIVNIDNESISAVKILGNFNPEDIDKLINDYNKDNKKG